MKTKSIKFSLDINKNKSAKYQILMIMLILGIVVFSAAYLIYTIIKRQKIKQTLIIQCFFIVLDIEIWYNNNW